MSLFVVQHKHDAAACPAGNAQVAPMLLKLLASAPQQGVTIVAEAVVDGGHELDMIVDAAAASAVEQFMAPFARMGSVTVRAASHCETVVDRGAC
jgi:1,4-dihydroxy-2-naphthoyl-CoA synthase